MKITLKNNKLFSLWFFYFLYTAAAAVLVQLIILPLFFPQWLNPEGFLESLLDSRVFHLTARDLAEKIKLTDWSAWELFPQGHAPSGIAAALYVFTGSSYLSLIPLNAAVHAFSALLLFLSFRIILREPRKAFFCAAPFFFFPSSAIWYSQLHKDGFFILGFIMIIYGWIRLLQPDKGFLAKFIRGSAFICAGLFLTWLMRRYLLLPLTFLSLLLSVLISAFLFFRSRNVFVLKIKPAVTVCVILLLICFLFFNYSDELKSDISCLKKVENITQDTQQLAHSKLIKLTGMRNGFITTAGKSNYYVEYVDFTNFASVGNYFLKAITLGFLSPFPGQWFIHGTFEANTLMRRVAGFEMVVTYISLIFLPYAVWVWRKRLEIWIILLFCLPMLILFSYVVCNIGTLYRMRYGFLTVLVGLGIAGAFQAHRDLRQKTTKKAS